MYLFILLYMKDSLNTTTYVYITWMPYTWKDFCLLLFYHVCKAFVLLQYCRLIIIEYIFSHSHKISGNITNAYIFANSLEQTIYGAY